jgi:hypothetical protein
LRAEKTFWEIAVVCKGLLLLKFTEQINKKPVMKIFSLRGVKSSLYYHIELTTPDLLVKVVTILWFLGVCGSFQVF